MLAASISAASTSASTARAALTQLVHDPTLTREALDTITGGGPSAIGALIDATSTGGIALREAWIGARSAADEFTRALGAVDDANHGALLRAASHAEAAADQLDVLVYGGGAHGSIAQVEARAGSLLETAASSGDEVRIAAPRIPRPWEWANDA
jgi:hypothetical protein